jgi:hypothetical protein
LKLRDAYHFADAAAWSARAHAIHLRSQPDVAFVDHLDRACCLRFACGHAAKAICTLRRAVANAELDQMQAADSRPWLLRAKLVAMLWLEGRAEEAAAVAAPACASPPEDVSAPTVSLLGVRAAAGFVTVDGAKETLAAWDASPLLASASRCDTQMVRYSIANMASILEGGSAPLRKMLSVFARIAVGLPIQPVTHGPLDPPLPDPFLGVIDDEAIKNLAELRECAHCGAKGHKLRRCARCHGAWYCDTCCQADNWRRHLRECRGCAKCGAKGGVLSLCSTCHRACYCSPACQRSHWPEHKIVCRRARDGANATVSAAIAAAAVAAAAQQ